MSASIVEIVTGDKGIQLANDYIVRQSSILSGTWQRAVIACRVLFNTNAATLLIGTPQFYFGICSGTSNAPGQVVHASVNHALFFRSAINSWAITTGTFQTAATNTGQVRAIRSGVTTTSNLTGISRLGGLNGSTPIRLPLYLDISREGATWTVDVSRRTTTTSIVDITTSAFMDSLAYDSMDSIAQVSSNGVSVSIDEGTHGTMNSVFASWDRSDVACRISEIVVVRKW